MNGVIFLALVTAVKSSEARLIQGAIYDLLTQTRMKHHMIKCGKYGIHQQCIFITQGDFHKHKGTFFALKHYCSVDEIHQARQSVFLDKFLSRLVLFLYNLGNVNVAPVGK